MDWLKHISANIVASFFMYYLFALDFNEFILFILCSVLVDIDHLIFFILNYKTINPTKIISIAKKLRKNMEAKFYLFHSPEFNISLLALSFFSRYAFIILISNLIHIALDIIEHHAYHKNFLWMREWSVIYNVAKLVHGDR